MLERPTTIREALASHAKQAGRAAAALPARLDDQHVPRRPQWECQTCEPGTSWPCPPAQVRLFEAYRGDRVGLSMYVGSLLYVATSERPNEDPRELYERIVGWIR